MKIDAAEINGSYQKRNPKAAFSEQWNQSVL
jgi:hypothetical protein